MRIAIIFKIPYDVHMNAQKWGIMKLGYSCNNGCIFCHASGQTPPHASLETLKRKIFKAAEMGLDGLLFSGGEPTLHPKLRLLTRLVSARGLQRGLITNGRMLAYDALAKQLVMDGCRTFFISLHAAEPAVHDQLTCCPGSWEQVVTGLKNLTAYKVKLDITINYVVTQLNMSAIPPFFQLLQELSINRVRFSLPEQKGRLMEQPAVIPSLRTAADFINRALEKAADFSMAAGYDGMPRCLIAPGRQHQQNDLASNRIFFMSEVKESDFYRTQSGQSYKPGSCLHCSLDPVCIGYYQGYSPGKALPKPISCLVPDHIPFYPLPGFPLPGVRCLLEHDPAWAGRGIEHIVVKRNNTLQPYATKNVLFASGQNAQKKKYTLYIDEHNEGLTHYRELEHQPQCTSCRLHCPGIFTVNKKFSSFAFDLPVQQELGRLRGAVLEVGFGDLYLAEWLLDNPAHPLQYFGIDPDREKVVRAQQEYPGRHFICTALEVFSYKTDFFDSALLSGSYNHLRNLASCLQNLQALLKPGGKLIILDNGIRGILKNQIPRLARDPGDLPEYQHYRNHSAVEATAVLQAAGFSIKTRQEAVSGGLWMVVGKKQ